MGLVHENGYRYYDENLNRLAMMDADGFWYWDETGTVRARMRDLGIRYLGENRNVVWSSPEH